MSLDLEDLKVMWLNLKAHVDQLAGERQQYLDVFEQSCAAYLVTDADGTIREANGAAVDILQRRRRHLQGKPFAALVALERRAQFREWLHKLHAGDARGPCSTVIESPGLRTEVTLTARLMPRGICWRLEAVE